MFPMISNRQYWIDRIRHERKCCLGLAVILAMLATSAQAQQPYAPPPEALWTQMVTALDGVSMPGPSNRQMMQILQQVQQQAQIEAARAKAAAKPKEAAP